VDSGAIPRSEEETLPATIRKGFFGSAEEVEAADAALAALVAELDQARAAVERYRVKYGEAVADPLTELRLRLQRGE
jgi:hypothetical protein